MFEVAAPEHDSDKEIRRFYMGLSIKSHGIFQVIMASFLSLGWGLPAESFYYLPDTGQTTCYNDKGGSKLITCPAPGSALAQDGSYSVYPPNWTNNGNGTAIENNTWVTWQTEDDGVLRTWDQAKSYCEGLNLGDYSDWRLPSRTELTGIVDYGRYNPAINTTIFQNTGSTNYWTASARPGNTEKYAVAFDNGTVSYRPPPDLYRTRCARGTPMPTGDYVANNDNVTITDRSTGLTWNRDRINGSNGMVLLLKWADALNYCEGLSLGGYSDWRLPNVKELSTITDTANLSWPPNFIIMYYWTSTTYLKDLTKRFVVSTTWDHPVMTFDKANNSEVSLLCVRGEQNSHLDPQELSLTSQILEFWDVGTRNIKTRDFTISNVGGGFLSIDLISPPSLPFSMLTDNCSSANLSPGASCNVSVEFLSSSTPGVSEGTLTINSNDLDWPQVTISLVGTVSPIQGSVYLLPDANEVHCYNNYGVQLQDCPNPGQNRAQDASYTINEPILLPNADGTVWDNNTRLRWQKEDDGVTRTWSDARNYCDSLVLSDRSDWRLPSKRELLSIVDYSYVSHGSLLINTDIFPSTIPSYYWTSIKDGKYEDYYWKINFISGISYPQDRLTLAYTRCVQGEELPHPILSLNDNGTVTDLATGLTWQQEGTWKNWTNAPNYCESLNLGGYSDWRLPNIKELESITDSSKFGSAIDDTLFPPIVFNDGHYYDGTYWVSNAGPSYCDGSASYYYINGPNGSVGKCLQTPWWVGGDELSILAGVLCVRGGDIKPALSHIYGTVSDASTGMKINGVRVTVVNSRKTASTFTSGYSTVEGDLGSYYLESFAPGPFTATFEMAGYATQVIEGSFIAGKFTVLNIQLGTTPPLNLSIVSPLDNAIVYANPVPVAGFVSNNGSVTVNGITAVTGGDNTYSALVSLIEGANTVTAIASDSYGQTASKNINVTLTTRGTITGTITDGASGNPIVSATLNITDSIGTPHSATTDASGSFTISGVSTGAFAGTVSKTGYLPGNISGSAVPGQTITLNTFLDAFGSIRGIVIDSANGLPLVSAVVSVTDSASVIHSASTLTDGTYTIADIPPGGFNGTISKGGYSSAVISGTAVSGQATVADAALTPVLPLIGNIQVNNITSSTADILWTTDQPTDGRVDYSITMAYDNTAYSALQTTAHSMFLSNLTPGRTYHFRITSTNSYGFSTSSVDNTFNTVGPITIVITTPLDNSTVMRHSVEVEGTVSNALGNETGVVVNGVLATVFGNRFAANDVPLTLGINVITASTKHTAGYTSASSVTIGTMEPTRYTQLNADVTTGLAPMETALTFGGTIYPAATDIQCNGPGQAEVLEWNVDQYHMRMTTEGIYRCSATVIGYDGFTYEDSIYIVALNATATDSMLRERWVAMRTRMSQEDATGALEYIHPANKEKYRTIFTALPGQLALIASEDTGLDFVSFRNNSAEYTLRRVENGENFSYEVLFERDDAGLWKILEH